MRGARDGVSEESVMGQAEECGWWRVCSVVAKLQVDCQMALSQFFAINNKKKLTLWDTNLTPSSNDPRLRHPTSMR